MANRYDVNIAGYALTVMSERSQEHMARLADTLNGRVREIQRSGGTANYLHVVMLAAMELADEVVELRERAAPLESEASGLREDARRLGEEARKLREEVEALRREREGQQDRLDRRSRDLLATLDSVLK